MKKLKPRVTFKKRRRNKMRHSHKMQQQMGGGIFDKAKIALANRKYEKMTASDILKLTDDTLPEYLDIIADLNLKYKMERDAKTILERTKNSWKATNYKNWGKGNDELDKKMMLYFTAYNKIAQILTKKQLKLLSSMQDGDARINNISKKLFDFFCKYITVINQVLESIQEQKYKNILLKMLYEHRVAGTLDDAKENDMSVTELGNLSLILGIKKYNIGINEIKLNNPDQMINQLKASIEKNNESIKAFKTGRENASNIIVTLDQGQCSYNRLPLVDNSPPVDISPSISPSISPLVDNSPPVDNSPTVVSNELFYPPKTSKRSDPKKSPFDDVDFDDESDDDESYRLQPRNYTEPNFPEKLSLNNRGGKRKRKQRGGGKNEILTSLRQFDEAASKQINAQPLESYVTFDDKPAQGPQLQPGSYSQDLSSIPVSTSRYAPSEQRQIEMEQFNRGQPQSYGSLEEIIARHDAANEKQTQKLIEQFNKLAELIQGRVQGPYQADRGIGTGEEVDVFSSSRSVSAPGSGTEAVNETFSKVDLSKLTSDSYAQTVRYLKLFKAIIEKQNQGKTAEESKLIIEKIDKAIANLQEIISEGFVKIDEETQASLKASGADIAEIMFSMLGIGVTSATLGGKRKRKTLKRMKKYKKSRQVRNTKKRHRKKHR